MRKLFFAIVILAGALANGRAQTINGVSINEISVQYIEIRGQYKLMSNKIEVEFDFGQPEQSNRQKVVRDEAGAVLNFNSMIEAVNWLSTYGWRLSFVITESKSGVEAVRYIMKRAPKEDG